MNSAESVTATKRATSFWKAAPASRTWLWVAAIFVGGWLVTLAILALLTANPVTLNRTQLLSSSALVVATVVDHPASGGARLRIDRVIAHERLAQVEIPQTIPLEQVPEKLDLSGQYLVPLRRIARGFQITPTRAPTETALVYPATEEVIARAQALLRNPGRGVH